MKREFSHRSLSAQVRAKAEKKGIEGYAAVFDKLSEELWGGMREKIVPGAFSDCLKSKPDVRALINHDANLVLGRTPKTLRLDEDETGLRFDCDTPDTQPARDLLTSIERGDISQCSFGFYVRKQKWSEEEDEKGNPMLVRELHKVDLFDVSAVTFPAYPQTSVDLRSLFPDGLPRALRAAERYLISTRGRRQDEDEEENENGCTCGCTDCQDDNCEACTNITCDDADCAEAGCPNQEQSPEENGRIGRIRIWPAEELRGAVAFKKTPADDSDTWDADAARGRLAKWASSDGSGDKDKIDWSKYAQGFAWVDPEQKENFGGYKLPHHDVKDGKLVSVWGGVQGAMNALLGGRGGTNIPEGDRKAVYNHLVKEYKLHGKEAPEFHSLVLIDEERWRLAARARAELARV